MSDLQKQFRESAVDAIFDMAQHLPLDCELLVVACRPGTKDFDLVLPSPESNLNNALDALRRHGLSIDGDNAYKRDLLDCAIGAMTVGAQDGSPPPPNHWAQRFWDIGRGEAAGREELIAALKLTRENLRACQGTIHLAGGFDPAYVDDAQAAMKIADAAILKFAN
ncbi:hypothetical protein QN386_01960 [Pseudomonas sp. CCI3.2]|uniref:hypothetical protein n=1 Tax=unclassified Pseudomonas TaxID=196821 RepID=UPI002AC8B9BC|nr:MULTISPECIES: hypothetical protein [unclassified Pseudomonas]MEB0076104.1 hypothetical protein [Pseudomonas sp. MH10out]MEB0090790.1 hypothetical protein [Pseudomonas sp. CCI4.2]MEB0100096.1 hypothetical protein [Pseudomonas sp. CCI3.2]MEB0132059.1 hypothetical protein [Pseudomonas sp. CCI2.4]MEB0156143.1 hypothetical protein [Pseudomonas sp. AH2 (2023)]